jgi:hypothetical protein
MKDKIVVEKSFFVQLVVSLMMTCAYFQEFLQSVWRLPVMVFLVVVLNMYFNAAYVGYKLKKKRLKLKWCFITSFNSYIKKSTFKTKENHLLN